MIKITLQKTISALIISGFAMTSQFTLAADPCDGSSTSDMVACAAKGLDSYKKQTQQAINSQKGKVPGDKFADLQRSQQAWETSTEALCDYKNKDGGTMDRVNNASCITNAWKNRAKNVKADAKDFKLSPMLDYDKQEQAKKSFLQEERKLDKKVQSVLNQINKETDEYNQDLMREKKSAYQQHIAAWKDFAVAYCSYQGKEFVCLNTLYKVKNKMVQKDYDWFFKSETERLNSN